ncbi:unnamed protein product [Rhizophagus irregularis]|uniref:Uncharacterized protein n=1 Tax=Rhizophagus irregularis TaxID=588596 RepID=A0A916EJY6_9GLOM|nr:unnamed protein product [Rhizophagus irregularis]
MDIMITQLFYQWIVMYIMSRNDNHTEETLQEFKIRRKLVLNLLNPINNTTKINSTFTKNIKLTSPGIEFLLSDFNNAFMDLSDKGAHELTLLGMNQLSRKVSTWFKGNPESIQIQLFHSATWSIGAKIYAKNNHYNHPRFSNIAIRMSADELDIYETVDGLCFAKLLLLFCLKDNSLTTDLAVIQWFDFKYQSEDLRLKHGCPYVKLLDEYDIIPIESITDLIHVIPHFGHDNSFFVNSFLF